MNIEQDRAEYYNRASTWDQEIIANALHSRNRAWLVAGASMAISIYLF
ncbi:MAG: hypothetical protein KAJ29_06715 [Alphaproteobacteria bacterium]|nr:hypothetical protein [Alphaproteobacteria bacterium]